MSRTSSSETTPVPGHPPTAGRPLSPASARRDELAANLAAVRERIGAACAAAGRAAGEITLIAVTKTWPASDVRLLSEVGVTDIGENRDQEAAPKAAACADLSLTWHFVGQLQTNKCPSVVRYAQVVHSVDRVRLIRALGAAARGAGRDVTCLLQVSLDGDPSRGGAPADQAAALAERAEAESGLLLGGVMAVAPLGMPPAAAFSGLRDIAAAVRSVRPAATIVSAGMSGDLEEAIGAGATHIRIGTALLGARRPRVM
ncbi:MAG: YggS family pyridoxal phosphate-dependent enzyme [Streptosporangiaceae bacterium]|nr:YggS family pyridoxal phosphate-dependent enzyme [Streptosporangiaceae bacterium]MBV9853375.1 YggS family pyridoxal phosphate-dependent enzyme [Streptosporangiaceae bacterium]